MHGNMIDLYLARGEASHVMSVVGVYVFGGVLLAFLLVIAMCLELRHRSRARAARNSMEKGAARNKGYVVLQGRVEVEEGSSEPAAVLRITQWGREWIADGIWHHKWIEQHRETSAKPFHLVLEDGQRVRVETQNGVLLSDALSREDRLGYTQRVRSAELRHGDTAFVAGELVEGIDPTVAHKNYRDPGKGLVLRPIDRSPLVASKEAPEDRHARLEGFHGGWALGIAMLGTLLHLALFPSFHLLHLTGFTMTPSTVDTVIVRERSLGPSIRGNRPVTLLRGTVGTGANATRLAAPVNDSMTQFLDSNPTAGEHVVFLVSGLAPKVHQAGPLATTQLWKIVVTAIAGLVLAIAYRIARVKRTPWYDRDRLDEEGEGRLSPAPSSAVSFA